MKHPPKRSKTPLGAKKRTARSIRRKRGIWSTTTADSKFSLFIRQRDGACKRCGAKEYLTCSHFWMRSHSATRFDPENCIALCAGPYSNQCHETWEHRKNYEYKEWMIGWLGQDKYDALERRARSYKNRAEAVAECKEQLNEIA